MSKIVNGTHYNDKTPDSLIDILERLRKSTTRVVLVYGDPDGYKWVSATPERGTIGRSSGRIPSLILLRTRRSLGGELILDDCILEIKESAGGKILYKRS